MKKRLVLGLVAALSAVTVVPACAEAVSESETEVQAEAAADEAVDEAEVEEVMAQFGLTSEDIQFVANILKQYNEGQTNLGLTEDNYYAEELKLAELGAALGNGELALWVGEIYQGGNVEGLSEAEAVDIAIEWWEKAVELGQPRGWTNIGLLYEHGNVPGGGQNYGDIEYDMDTALEYLKKADEAGDTKAPRYIAKAYESDEDYENALPYFEKAAGIGDITSNYYVGEYYLDGKGTDVDYDKALQYLTVAATNEKVVPGVADAQYTLGTMYENGLGVDVDVDAAKEWYTKASDNGNEDAAAALENLQ